MAFTHYVIGNTHAFVERHGEPDCRAVNPWCGLRLRADAGRILFGQTIEIGVSSTAGGGYDTHARLLARHMPRYIPGHPAMVVKNVDGASGLRLANMLYNTAPKDGTVFGTIYRSTSFDPLFGNNAAHFDASKFTWIGSASNEVSICVAWHTSSIASFDDMLARELIVATGNQGGDATQ